MSSSYFSLKTKCSSTQIFFVCTLVYLDAIWVKFEGQGHRSKFSHKDKKYYFKPVVCWVIPAVVTSVTSSEGFLHLDFREDEFDDRHILIVNICKSKVISFTHFTKKLLLADAHSRPSALPGPLKWSAKLISTKNCLNKACKSSLKWEGFVVGFNQVVKACGSDGWMMRVVNRQIMIWCVRNEANEK